MQRYFVNEKQNHFFLLSKEDSYHILTVMRMVIGDKIEVVCDKILYLCEIDDVKENLVKANILEQSESNVELPCQVTIAQAVVKEQKMDFIIQKTTELGVTSIQPYIASRSMVKVEGKQEKKIDRWQRIAKEASEQSKRREIPSVLPIVDVDKLCKVECEMKLLCTVNETSTTLKSVFQNLKKDDRIIIVVGPEGGFTDEEEKKLMESGFISVSLGNLVLRTETVGLYMMSIINYYFMR